MTFFVVKDFPHVEEFVIIGTDGPNARFPGVTSGDGATGEGKGEKAGGDGITVVLNGFPPLLHKKC